MAQTVPLDAAWSFQLQDTAKISRLILGAMFDQSGTLPNTTWRSGVLPSVCVSGTAYPTDLLVFQNSTPNLGVALNSGSYVINRPSQGPYIGEVQNQITSASGTPITLTTAPGTGQSRIDIVALQVLDTAVGDSSLAAQAIVVTGTAAATGSQVAPTLPATGAVIPLAQVLVGPNVTTIVTANITDVRKSASVSGGPRLLLPGDALSDPGNCWGELRQRVLSTYPSNGVADVITEYWGFDSAWHGTKNLNPGQAAWQNGTSNVTLNNSTFSPVLAVSIPDPGYAYYLECAAGCTFFSTVAWTAGSPPLTNMQITLDTVGGTVISNQQFGGNYTALGASYPGELPKRKSARLTGAHTVLVSAQSNTTLGGGTQGAAYTGFTGNQAYLDVTVVPA